MVPDPLRETICGLPVALSVKVSVPVAAPFALGVKVTEIVQAAPTASVAAQVLVWAKPLLALMLVRLTEVVPVFVRVTVCGGLVVDLSCVPKARLVGETETVVEACAHSAEIRIRNATTQERLRGAEKRSPQEPFWR
jgi:hypothetical protein